jgi:hypothetical protein
MARSSKSWSGYVCGKTVIKEFMMIEKLSAAALRF